MQVSDADRSLPWLKVLRPEGQGPFPTVIMLHGCGGLQPLQWRYARAVQAAGAAAVVVDSFAHRGISRTNAHLTICTGLRLRGATRARDLFEVVDWLEGQAWADPQRLTAAGWSHGAWTIMDALALAGRSPVLAQRAAALRRAVLVYPYCGPPSLTLRRGWGALSPAVTAIVCGRDQVVGQRAPLRSLDRVRKEGAPVDLHLFDDATHAFEDSEASDPRTRYRPDLTARATALLVDAVIRPD